MHTAREVQERERSLAVAGAAQRERERERERERKKGGNLVCSGCNEREMQQDMCKDRNCAVSAAVNYYYLH